MNLHKKLFFDYYAVSLNVPRGTLLDAIRQDIRYQHSTIEPTRARHGYAEAYAVRAPDLGTDFTFMLGGSNGEKIHCYASGESASPFYEFLNRHDFQGELTRADVAVDFDEPAAWQSLYKLTQVLERELGYTRRYVGPALCELGETEKGRTIYVGSRMSAGMLRLYEKGKKDDNQRPDWCRLELELKPQNKAARAALYCADPLEVWSAHRMGGYVSRVFMEKAGMPLALSRVQPRHAYDVALQHMAKQYAKAISWKLEKLGGDAGAFVSSLLSADT